MKIVWLAFLLTVVILFVRRFSWYVFVVNCHLTCNQPSEVNIQTNSLSIFPRFMRLESSNQNDKMAMDDDLDIVFLDEIPEEREIGV